MADIITKELPDSVTIDGREVHINTDFRRWMQLSEVMSSNEYSEEEKAVMALMLAYGNIPSNIPEAFKRLLLFFRGGVSDDFARNTAGGDRSTEGAIYSFEYDSEYIYAAFMEQYRIDLTTAKLHWWQFKALFKALNENTMFSKIMGYRGMELSDIKDKKLRERYSRLKELYALPDMRTDEEKEADWGAAF